MTKILGCSFKGFHRRWLDFQLTGDATLVLAPRGHGKTTILNVGFSLWRVLRDHNHRILVVSATGFQAQGFLREMRSHIEKNAALIAAFGNLRGDRWTEREFTLADSTLVAKESNLTAIGVEGGIISRHYDTIILDDVLDEKAARSARSRDRIEEWYYKVLKPCLEPHGRIHLLGTRYHPDDLYGRLMEKAESIEFSN